MYLYFSFLKLQEGKYIRQHLKSTAEALCSVPQTRSCGPILRWNCNMKGLHSFTGRVAIGMGNYPLLPFLYELSKSASGQRVTWFSEGVRISTLHIVVCLWVGVDEKVAHLPLTWEFSFWTSYFKLVGYRTWATNQLTHCEWRLGLSQSTQYSDRHMRTLK